VKIREHGFSANPGIPPPAALFFLRSNQPWSILLDRSVPVPGPARN